MRPASLLFDLQGYTNDIVCAKTRREAEVVADAIEGDTQAQELLNVESTLSETKKAIQKTTNQVKREIPKYTEAFTELSEETVQAYKEIGFEWIEMQKEFSSVAPKYRKGTCHTLFPGFPPQLWLTTVQN